MANEKDKPRGMPIYLDGTDRRFASFDSDCDSPTWFPSNHAAQKLWRCVEAVRDLEVVLEAAGEKKTDSRRSVKIAITQLHTLASTVHDLCNYFSSNESFKEQLSKEQLAKISLVRKELESKVSVRTNSEFDKIRNKLSAHIDSKMFPHETLKISNSLNAKSFYSWLVYTIKAFVELTNINVYHWSCESKAPNSIAIMCTEPFVATMQMAPEPRLISLNIANGSPRNEIPVLCSRVLDLADWMRPSGAPRLKLVDTPSSPGF